VNPYFRYDKVSPGYRKLQHRPKAGLGVLVDNWPDCTLHNSLMFAAGPVFNYEGSFVIISFYSGTNSFLRMIVMENANKRNMA